MERTERDRERAGVVKQRYREDQGAYLMPILIYVAGAAVASRSQLPAQLISCPAQNRNAAGGITTCINYGRHYAGQIRNRRIEVPRRPVVLEVFASRREHFSLNILGDYHSESKRRERLSLSLLIILLITQQWR